MDAEKNGEQERNRQEILFELAGKQQVDEEFCVIEWITRRDLGVIELISPLTIIVMIFGNLFLIMTKLNSH